MKTSRLQTYKALGLVVLALAAFCAARPSLAQNMSAPIVVKSSTAPVKPGWLKVEVIHADSNSMVVREQANSMMVHTFTYSPALQAAIQKIVDAGGGYQYGDKIKILCQQGQTVALRIDGRPSK
ncbi:MAG: hypothetical protein ABSF78_04910 [Candidatus Acidiferrales bacterium]|jgi:hypothetical protein